MKPQKLAALPVILGIILPAVFAFNLFIALAQAFITFFDDALIFWEALVEWWEE